MKRDIENGVKCKTVCIAKEIGEYFSVSLRKSVPLIIVEGKNGDITMLWQKESRVIQRNSKAEREIYFNLIMADSFMRFIYLNNGSIITRGTGEGINEAVRLDTVQISGGLPYRLIPVINGGYAVLYNRRMPETEFGYRELTAKAVGDYRKIYNTGFDIGDSSVCSDGDSLHFVFVSMSRFAVRVMYAGRSSEGLSKPKNLWEGSRCGKVCIAADGCDVFVWWESGGNIYESCSHNGGESFEQCVRRSRIGTYSKALHLSQRSFGISEIMVSEGGDIYAPEPVKELISCCRGDKRSDAAYTKADENISAEKALAFKLREELIKKQQEIDRLTHVLQNKNQESSKIEYTLRKRCNQLNRELNMARASQEQSIEAKADEKQG